MHKSSEILFSDAKITEEVWDEPFWSFNLRFLTFKVAEIDGIK